MKQFLLGTVITTNKDSNKNTVFTEQYMEELIQASEIKTKQ